MPTEAEIRANQSVAKNLRDIIGQGIDFPIRFVRGGKVGTVELSNAGERIHDSIHLILATGIGERMFNPEFGSRLPELVFEPNDEILKRLLRIYTAEALARWERRIEVVEVILLDNYNDDGNTVGIRVTYTIRNSHIRGSYVFPFVREGSPTEDLYTGSEVQRMNTRGTTVL